MIAWKGFSHEGKFYDLSHLHPQVNRFIQPSKAGQPERIYDVQVIFSLHCFTRSCQSAEEASGVLAYSDSRETRIFDFHRYECSKRLPAIVQALPTASCYHTGHGNFFTVEILNDETRSAETYEVYFSASRSGTKPVRVNLFVQSAYVRDPAHRTNRPKGKRIGFFVILHNTLHGKTIKPAP
jgi:hypothetical protein